VLACNGQPSAQPSTPDGALEVISEPAEAEGGGEDHDL
jgi:hypothetical protein